MAEGPRSGLGFAAGSYTSQGLYYPVLGAWILNLLVIDTSTKSTVLGLSCGGDLLDRTTPHVKTHSREILPSIEQLLLDAELPPSELDGIVFGQGPGSFTGLRIAVGVVQGLAYGLNIPTLPVSSMAALAFARGQHFSQPVQILVALSARLEEVYYGAYEVSGESARPLIAEGVADVTDLSRLQPGRWHIISDCPQLQSKIENATGAVFESADIHVVPEVASLLALGSASLAQGESVQALAASPVYLREQVANKPGEA